MVPLEAARRRRRAHRRGLTEARAATRLLKCLWPPLSRAFVPLDGADLPGAPSFALFAKGGAPQISIPTVAYPTLCQERKGWGTRLSVVRPAVPNTNRGLIEELFLIRKPHEVRLTPQRSTENPGGDF
jgi:hypothetical protein